MGKSLRTYHTFVLLDLPDIGNLISQQEGLLKVNLLAGTINPMNIWPFWSHILDAWHIDFHLVDFHLAQRNLSKNSLEI